MNFDKFKNFDSKEFDSPDLFGSGSKMNYSFINRLQNARNYAKISFIILSGYRTYKHNLKVGGVLNSSHLKGCACDIYYSNSKDAYTILTSLILSGFTRFGINNHSIHVDDDDDKPINVLWNYY